MSAHTDELIATLLGDAPASARLRRWLGTDAGRCELAAYRAAIGAVRQLYGDLTVSPPRDRVYVATLRTPIGPVLVAASEAGLVRIGFRQSESSFTAELRLNLGAELVRSAVKTADILAQLRAYFAGKRRTFDLPVDLQLATPFQRRVLLATAGVPAGAVVPYGEIARRIGQPGASRAVGQALGQNPIPIVIPCHRIVGSSGLGGYGGGLAIKKKLLALEGVL